MIDLKGFSEFLGDVKHQFWIDISIYPWRLIFKNKCSVFAYKQVGAIKTQWRPIPKATKALKLILCNTAAENFEKSVILKPSRNKVGINEKRTWVWLISRIWVPLTDIYLNLSNRLSRYRAPTWKNLPKYEPLQNPLLFWLFFWKTPFLIDTTNLDIWKIIKTSTSKASK